MNLHKAQECDLNLTEGNFFSFRFGQKNKSNANHEEINIC